MLGGEPVADGEHRRARTIREPTADAVVGVQAADGPAAAVQVDHQRPRPGGGPIQVWAPADATSAAAAGQVTGAGVALSGPADLGLAAVHGR